MFSAALYESWSLPWSVLLSTPVAVFGATRRALAAPRCAAAGFCRRYMVQMENDVYTQIGSEIDASSVWAPRIQFLIVAFAKEEYERGRPLVDAALDGARLSGSGPS